MPEIPDFFTPRPNVFDTQAMRDAVARAQEALLSAPSFARVFDMSEPSVPLVISVPGEHVHPVTEMGRGRRNAMARIITSRNPAHTGLVLNPRGLAEVDPTATGVLITYTGDSDVYAAMVRPDPGVGSYVVEPPTVTVPYGHLRGASSVGYNTQCRVIFSRHTEHIGTLVRGGVAYDYDEYAWVVPVALAPNADEEFGENLYPDPGPGQYVVPGYTVINRKWVLRTNYMPYNANAMVRVTSAYRQPNWVGCLMRVDDTAQSSRVDGVLLSFDANRVADPANAMEYQRRTNPDPGPGPYLLVNYDVPVDPAAASAPAPACDVCDKPVTRCRCTACATCGLRVARRGDGVTRIGRPARFYHNTCVRCAQCNGNPDNCGPLERVQGFGSHVFCANCRHRCVTCRSQDFWLPPSQRYCQTCAGDGAGGDDAVGSYRHTAPTRWLGGPLPRTADGKHQAGFYIGFELEVSSSLRYGGDVTSLREWSQEHLGFRDGLDIKTDSSVQGFEIASQPMTPEFFESVDWSTFMDVLNRDHRTTDRSPSREPYNHGLHVHVGRVAFDRDDVATAMFCYLIGQPGAHLERIGRRDPFHYCEKIGKPASAALVDQWVNTGLGGTQAARLQRQGVRGNVRGAINLLNEHTIEVRAFRSTRDPEHFKAAVRFVYLAAQYVSHLRGERGKNFVSPKALHFDSFIKWVGEVHPEAVEGLTADVPKEEVAPRVITPRLRVREGLTFATTTDGNIIATGADPGVWRTTVWGA